jgi:hypothetical protein
MFIYDLYSNFILAATISSGILSTISGNRSVFDTLANDVDEKTSIYIDIKKVNNLVDWMYT